MSSSIKMFSSGSVSLGNFQPVLYYSFPPVSIVMGLSYTSLDRFLSIQHCFTKRFDLETIETIVIGFLEL